MQIPGSRLLIFLSMLAAFVCAPADASMRRAWNCQISAKMIGAGKNFMFYGLDSWNGEGSLYCESGSANIYRTVAVSFNSLYSGFGADRNSVVQLLVDLSTTMDPKELQIRSLVNNRSPSPRIEWNYLSELTAADVFVTAATPQAARLSLQQGTLFIRNSGD